jgi:hypothetical protein
LDALFSDLKHLIDLSRLHTATAVNVALVARNWRLGRRILEDILAHRRAGYGEEIVATLKRDGRLFERTAISKRPALLASQEISSLQELGTDFCFVARQKRMTKPCA